MRNWMGIALFLCGAFWVGKAWSQDHVNGDCGPQLATHLSSAEAPEGSVDIKVSSLNLREFRYENGYFKQKSSFQIRELGRIIRAENADVLSVQEVASEEALIVFNRRFLEGKYKIHFSPSRDKYGQHAAFLVRKDLAFDVKMEVHDHETWIDKAGDGRTRYLFTHGVPTLILLRKGSRYASAVVMGYHGKSNFLPYDFKGNVDERREYIVRLQTAQILGLRGLVNHYERRFPGAAVVAAGDFNLDVLNSPIMNPLREYMTDAFDIAGLERHRRITHLYFERGVGPARMRQLDAILVNPAGIDAVLTAWVRRFRSREGDEQPLPRSVDERDLLQPSDHFMISSILRLRRR